MTYWHFASAPSGGCGLHDLFLGLVLGGELASFLSLLGLFLCCWARASAGAGLELVLVSFDLCDLLLVWGRPTPVFFGWFFCLVACDIVGWLRENGWY